MLVVIAAYLSNKILGGGENESGKKEPWGLGGFCDTVI